MRPYPLWLTIAVYLWQALPAEGDPSTALTPSSPPVVSSAPADGADFIPSETFTGSKLGYVFQSGSLGTGYYKDGVDKGMPLPPSPVRQGAEGACHI